MEEVSPRQQDCKRNVHDVALVGGSIVHAVSVDRFTRPVLSSCEVLERLWI